MPLALPCRYGWLRLNSDWFLVEPIDPEGRTWYGRSLASRGKDSQCHSAYHPVVRRCSEVMVSAISCTKLDVASKGAAWPGKPESLSATPCDASAKTEAAGDRDAAITLATRAANEQDTTHQRDVRSTW
jgi:hypothetical protein